MAFTLVAWYESTTEAKTLYAINALPDPHLRIVDNDVYVPSELPFLLAYMALHTLLTQARVESPSLRALANIDVIPLELDTEPGSPPNLVDKHLVPKALVGLEGLEVKISASAAALPVALAWLGSGPIAPVTGEVFTVKASASPASAAYAWTNASLTFEQTLPVGRYQVVGMRAKSTSLIAARLVFSGFAWRPGCLGCDAYSDIETGVFRAGSLGIWGEFSGDVPPTVDFLSRLGDTSVEVWLDLIKIA